MDKASKAIRRSGVRIRSIGSGHSDLQMVISQMKDLRTASKAFTTAQSEAMQDLVKWSLKGENRAITDALDSDRITMDDIAVATSVARNEP